MTQLAVHFQMAPTQIEFKDDHMDLKRWMGFCTHHTLPLAPPEAQSQVLRYIRHKWVTDKPLPTPRAFAPFIQPKHLTCVCYSFNICLAPCPAHRIAPDCWTFRPKPLNLSSVRWRKGWDTKGPRWCVCVLCVSACVHVLTVYVIPVRSLMCLMQVSNTKIKML